MSTCMKNKNKIIHSHLENLLQRVFERNNFPNLRSRINGGRDGRRVRKTGLPLSFPCPPSFFHHKREVICLGWKPAHSCLFICFSITKAGFSISGPWSRSFGRMCMPLTHSLYVCVWRGGGSRRQKESCGVDLRSDSVSCVFISGHLLGLLPPICPSNSIHPLIDHHGNRVHFQGKRSSRYQSSR